MGVRQSFLSLAQDCIQRMNVEKASTAPVEHYRAMGIDRLRVAAKGLPVTLDELTAFYAGDLEAIGKDEMPYQLLREFISRYAVREGKLEPAKIYYYQDYLDRKSAA